MIARVGQPDDFRQSAERIRAAALRWGVSWREAGKLLGLSSLYLSAILIGIACRQLELLQDAATRRENR